MNTPPSSTKSTILAGLSLALLTAAASSAMAMPGSAGVAADTQAVLHRAAYQHRVYPGSDSAAAEKARDDRKAPNMYCEKHENLCE